jgi:hypothetical protein
VLALSALAVQRFEGSRSVRAAPSGRAAASTSVGSPTRVAAAGRKRFFWGAWIGDQFTHTEAPWDMRAVRRFQRLTGKGLSVIHFSSPFADCRPRRCVRYVFPTRAFDAVRSYGAIPFFSWGSNAKPLRTTKSKYSLRKIISGVHDAYIRTWAIEARDWGHPFFLQFDWEMNGTWYPWSEGTNGNHPGEFVKAWRHVHDVFASVGATNVTWIWCPNVDPSGVFAPLYPLYPGSAYVDWTCLDGYNRDRPWQSFDELFGSSYRLLSRIAPTKPIIIGEIGSTERGGSKAAWITDLLTVQLPSRYPLIRGVLWFEKYGGHDWPIETSKTARTAFARGIASAVYEPNIFASLTGSRILPPS